MLHLFLSIVLTLLLVTSAWGIDRQTLFSAVEPTGTEVYSSTIIVEQFPHVIIQSDATVASTTIVTTIYGRVRDSSSWVTLGTLTHTVTGNLMLNIVERIHSIRVGHKTTGDIAGDVLTVYLEGK